MKQRVKRPVLVLLGISLIGLFSATLFGFHQYVQHDIDKHTRSSLLAVGEMFRGKLNEDALLMEGFIDFIKKDQQLRNAWLAKERETLLHIATPIFKNMRSRYNITHFYFHDVKQVNFLRVHNPSRYGDYINRSTMAGAIDYGETVHGIELGPFGTLTLRVVSPWRIDGQQVGYIELGKEIEHITPTLSKILRADLIFAIDKSHLDRTKWEEGLQMTGRSGNWDQLRDFVIVDHTVDLEFSKLQRYLKQDHRAHARLLFDMVSGDRRYRGGFVMLSDHAGRDLGDIVVIRDITATLSEAHKSAACIVGAELTCGVVLLAVFWFFIGRIEQRLTKKQKDLEDEIAERRKAEKTLKKSEADHRELVEKASSIIFRMDLEGNITFLNKFARRFFGYAQNEILGKNVVGSILARTDSAGQDLEEMIRNILIHPEKFTNNENENIRKNGETVWVTWTNTPLRNEEGHLSEILCIGNDVTEKKLMQIQLVQAQKLESIGQLAAGIAHEINTPIQYVGDNLQFLKDVFADMIRLQRTCDPLIRTNEPASGREKIAAAARKIAEEIDIDYLVQEIPEAVRQSLEGVVQVTKIVKSMKEFSHPGTKGKAFIDMNRALESTVTVTRNQWKYIANLTLYLAPDLPQVCCLPGEINQVFLNLIVNAIQAIEDSMTQTNGHKGNITIRTRKCSEVVEVSISDTGPGIPPEIQERIFDPFFTTKEVGRATGQGLTIARSVVVEQHGGSIDCETQEGHGTTFVVRLPIEPLPGELQSRQSHKNQYPSTVSLVTGESNDQHTDS